MKYSKNKSEHKYKNIGLFTSFEISNEIRKQALKFHRYSNNKDLTKKFINITKFSSSNTRLIIQSELNLMNMSDFISTVDGYSRIKFLGFIFVRKDNYWDYFPANKTNIAIEDLHKRFTLNTPNQFINFIQFIKDNESYINICML